MRIAFTDEVLADPDSWRWLDRILESVENEWHLWEIVDPEAVEQSEWFRQAGRSQRLLRELLEASARRGAWRRHTGPHSVLVIVDVMARPPCVLDAQRAARAMREPLVVLLENTESDGAFVDTVLEVLGNSALSALRRIEPAPFKYDSPGGSGEIIKRLERALDDPAWTGIPRRFIVLTDSDARAPGRWSKKACQIAEYCRTRGVTCHVLEKRAIENYLPQQVLDDWAAAPARTKHRPWVEAISRLSPEQRSHFSMKSGLDSDPHDDIRQSLYGGLTPADRLTLACGIRKQTLPKLFETYRASMTPASLRACAGLRGDGSTELDELVALICAAL